MVSFSAGSYVVSIARSGGDGLRKIQAENLRRVGLLRVGDMAEIHGLDGTDEERLNGELATIKVSASSLFWSGLHAILLSMGLNAFGAFVARPTSPTMRTLWSR